MSIANVISKMSVIRSFLPGDKDRAIEELTRAIEEFARDVQRLEAEVQQLKNDGG